MARPAKDDTDANYISCISAFKIIYILLVLFNKGKRKRKRQSNDSTKSCLAKNACAEMPFAGVNLSEIHFQTCLLNVSVETALCLSPLAVKCDGEKLTWRCWSLICCPAVLHQPCLCARNLQRCSRSQQPRDKQIQTVLPMFSSGPRA